VTRREIERELERQLGELPLPGDAEAEERAWELIRTAHAERQPLRPSRHTRRIGVVAGIGALALAIGLSPAGARVGDFVFDVVGIGENDAKPALGSLPAAGELLVESAQGVWILRGDGSKRLLGDYDEASWSPRGLYIAAVDDRELVAVDPLGGVRWTVTAPGPVSDPRWGGVGSDTRIAYRSGNDLWVVAGDGTGERLIARGVAPVAPAWRPVGESKITAAPGDPATHVLAYVSEGMDIRAVAVDSETRLRAVRGDAELLSTPTSGQTVGPATSPDGRSLAALRPAGRRTEVVMRRESGRSRVLFSARGPLTGPTWSPDGRWLLVGWPAADQWLFISAERPDRVVAFDRISEQFDPGGDGEGRIPRVAGWILPER
jgi:hypothetical protein